MCLIETPERVLYHLEAIDIENNEYLFWDSTGVGVCVSVARGGVKQITSCTKTISLLEAFEAYEQSMADTRSHLSVMRQKREKLKFEIANFARAIAEGHNSTALLNELGNRKSELDGISENLLAADGRGLDARFQGIEEFVLKRLQDIRGLLLADVPRAKAELSKHTAITLTPEGSSFRISGDWDLLGGRSGGAGGQNRT
jgi:hypothetical protein